MFIVSTNQTIDFNLVPAATCSGVSVPSSVTTGASFNATVSMINNGPDPWIIDTTPHRLGAQNDQDNTRWGLNRVDLPFSVQQGQQVTFSFSAIAPTTIGPNPFDWQLLEEGVQWFGQTCTFSIQVTAP